MIYIIYLIDIQEVINIIQIAIQTDYIELLYSDFFTCFITINISVSLSKICAIIIRYDLKTLYPTGNKQ